MREIVSLQIGQCGNKIGTEFWSQICREHGINIDGTLLTDYVVEDNKDVFFYQTRENRYYPRAILMDLEPRSSENKDLFNPENVFLSTDGCGAGNNWGIGYVYGNKYNDELLEIVDKEVDNAENFEGSGIGSYLLELINENYPKKVIETFSVFPQLKDSSDVVVQPYNTILSLKRLILNADLVNIIDNNIVNSTNWYNTITSSNTTTPSNSHTTQSNNNNIGYVKENLQYNNKLIGNIMCNITSNIRFPGPINNDLISLISSLVIIPRCHFLVSSVKYDNQTTLLNLIKKLYYSNNFLIYTNMKNGKYLSALNIIRGDEINPLQIKEKNLINFINWNPSSVLVNLTKQSPFSNDKLNGILIANHTSINQYNKLYTRRAFLDNYRKVEFFASSDGKGNFEEMEHSKEVVELVRDEYIRAEQDDYYDLSCN